MNFQRGQSRPAIAAAVAVVVLTLGGLGVAFAWWPVVNTVSTGESAAYPELMPQPFRYSQSRVFSAVVEEALSMPGASLISREEELTTLEFALRGPVSMLDTRVVARVEANGEAGAIVFVRSELLAAMPGDFGQNARNIRQLQERVTRNLGDDPAAVR